MPYVQRKQGAIVGLFEAKQPRTAIEFLPDDDAEVERYRARVSPAARIPREAAIERLQAMGKFDAFMDEIERPGRRFLNELWYASPTIAADDGRFLEVLRAIGAETALA